ncbi:ATP-binding protein [Streptomyces sp. NPDC048106]|uniref:ATP-binding protein n=1 Tax=Streptomyces sp. NPDC048106 TaxID=3155750 RepID=UPI00345162A5
MPPTLLTHDWAMSFPMTTRSVPDARVQVRRRLTLWNWTGDVDDAVLVASELVANAVVHGKVPGHQLWLRLKKSECGELIVEVSDPVRTLPRLNGQGPGGEGGRGLLIVSELAEELDWYLRAELGKTVRARLGTRGPN